MSRTDVLIWLGEAACLAAIAVGCFLAFVPAGWIMSGVLGVVLLEVIALKIDKARAAKARERRTDG